MERQNLKVHSILQDASARLDSVTQRPQHEAKILLAHTLNVEPIWLITHSNDEIDIKDSKRFDELVARREKYEPIEYITNSVSFYSDTFFIQKGALIPRPETELLVDLVSRHITSNMSMVEVGVGSGALSITLCKLHPDLKVIATDISVDALEVAKRNVALHNVANQITLINTNMLDSVNKYFDIIVSNPPYIANSCKLEPNLDYEPSQALYGGEVGDEFLLQLIDEAIKREVKFLFCEMGYDQRESIKKYCNERSLHVSFYKDLSNLDRGFVIEF